MKYSFISMLILAAGVWFAATSGSLWSLAAFSDPESATTFLQVADTFPILDDGDGISSGIDGEIVGFEFVDHSGVFSSSFTDQHVGGTSFGSIGDRNGLVINVEDAAAPDGMSVQAMGLAGPQAGLILCGFPLTLGAGASIQFTCGSLILQVFDGPIQVFPAPDVIVTLPSGTSATISTLPDGQVEVQNSPDSQGTVIVEIGGVEFPVEPGGQTAITARGLKESALAILLPYEEESKRIKKAIKEIGKSLDDDLWIDGSHLDTKHGHKVFDRERHAVKDLLHLLENDGGKDGGHGKKGGKDEASAAAMASAEAAIERLLAADRLLAQTAIGGVGPAVDAQRQDKVDKEMAKALQALAKGGSEAGVGKAGKAIDHYKNAWKHAIHAANEAAKEPKPGGNHGSDNGSSKDSKDDG